MAALLLRGCVEIVVHIASRVTRVVIVEWGRRYRRRGCDGTFAVVFVAWVASMVVIIGMCHVVHASWWGILFIVGVQWVRL